MAYVSTIDHDRRRREGYLSLVEVANKLGIMVSTLRSWSVEGRVPKATREYPGVAWKYYDPRDIAAITQYNTSILVSQRRVAHSLNVSDKTMARAIQEGRLSPPTHKRGMRLYYTQEEAKDLTLVPKAKKPQELTTKDCGLVNLSELSRVSGATRHVIELAIAQGRIPAPTHIMPGCIRNNYHESEVPALVEGLKAPWQKGPATTHEVKADPEGLVSALTVRKLAKVSTTTMTHHYLSGAVVRPTIAVPGYGHMRFWSKEEADKILAFLVNKKGRVPKGYVRKRDIPVKLATLKYHIDQGHIPAASHTFPGVRNTRYYSADEARKVRAFFRLK